MEQVEIIKKDSIIDLQVSDDFIKRIQALMVYHAHQVSPEELTLQVNNIKENKELSEWGQHFETLLILVNEIEVKAKEQGKIEFIPAA